LVSSNSSWHIFYRFWLSPFGIFKLFLTYILQILIISLWYLQTLLDIYFWFLIWFMVFTFTSYFCKMWVKIMYWSPDGELIFSEHFHSITDRIFHLNPTLIFQSFKPHNWLRHKSFKSHTFHACKWPR
jgi:hypothetical protein